jgi:hypothetical protein
VVIPTGTAGDATVVRIEGTGLGSGGRVFVDGQEMTQAGAGAGFVLFLVPMGSGPHSVFFTNKFDKTGDAPVKLLQENLTVTDCAITPDPAAPAAAPRQLLTVRGTGFAAAGDGGKLVLLDTQAAAIKPSAQPLWRSARQWEISLTSAELAGVASIQITNPGVPVETLATKARQTTPDVTVALSRGGASCP